MDPIGPTALQECRELYDRYAEIASALEAEAKVQQDRANEILMGAGFALAPAIPYLDEASRIRGEANNVRSHGRAAQSRCYQQVQAHQRNQNAQRQQGQSGFSVIQQTVGQQTAVGIAMAGIAGYSGGQFGRATSTRALAAGTMQRVIGNFNLLKAVAGRGPTNPYSSVGLFGQTASSLLNEVGHFNRLQTYVVNLAINLVVDLNRSAMADLEASVGEFDGTGTMTRFESLANDVSAQLSAAGGRSYDDLSGLMDDTERVAAELVADRGSRAQDAVVRPAPVPTRAGGNSGGGGAACGQGGRCSPSQCSALVMQINHLRSVLPQYQRAGQGAFIEAGIRGNQIAYQRGCQ